MKYVILLAVLIAAVAAQYGGQHHELEHYVDYVGHPKYHFDYAVNDPHTHDEKKQWETRDGHHVKGQYSLVQPDGKTRIVSYESDGKGGINYHVQYVKHGSSYGSGISGGSGGGNAYY